MRKRAPTDLCGRGQRWSLPRQSPRKRVLIRDCSCEVGVHSGIGRRACIKLRADPWRKPPISPLFRTIVLNCGSDRAYLHAGPFQGARFLSTVWFHSHKRSIEIADDPTLTGTLQRSAAPHVPLIESAPIPAASRAVNSSSAWSTIARWLLPERRTAAGDRAKSNRTKRGKMSR
jgi:hypothetical protein